MKKFILCAAGVIALVAMIGFFGGRPHFRHVSATGVCNAKVAKDRLAITLEIKSLDKNAAVSLRAAQNAADEFARAMRAIDDKTIEIQTTRIASYEKTKWEKNTSVLLGIESEIDLEITSAKRETIDAAIGLTAPKNVQVFPRNMRNFSSREVLDDATQKCLHAAIMDARDKAAAMAAADGEKLGRMISARFGSVDGSDEPRDMVMSAVASRSEKALSADYIQTSDGDLSITVGATFGIK
jgi:uncharacterized protein YggE